jgi:CO/xanthine dehydrogenase Mo-binding subunit
MGLSYAGSETFVFDENGVVQDPQLRSYHTLRYGELPEFVVEFFETPAEDGPFGARFGKR